MQPLTIVIVWDHVAIAIVREWWGGYRQWRWLWGGNGTSEPEPPLGDPLPLVPYPTCPLLRPGPRVFLLCVLWLRPPLGWWPGLLLAPDILD